MDNEEDNQTTYESQNKVINLLAKDIKDVIKDKFQAIDIVEILNKFMINLKFNIMFVKDVVIMLLEINIILTIKVRKKFLWEEKKS